jgi:hypothetical protein
MTSLTDTHPFATVGVCGDGRLGGVAVLEHPIVLENVFCPVCKDVTRFVIEFQLWNGLIGSCVRCGDERVAAFSRSVSEETA